MYLGLSEGPSLPIRHLLSLTKGNLLGCRFFIGVIHVFPPVLYHNLEAGWILKFQLFVENILKVNKALEFEENFCDQIFFGVRAQIHLVNICLEAKANNYTTLHNLFHLDGKLIKFCLQLDQIYDECILGITQLDN